MASKREVLGTDPTGTDCPLKHWLPVEVPTTVQASLVNHDRAPYPWRDRNARALEIFESETWWFRHEFELPTDAAEYGAWELHFEGVSLFATVWLNGAPVGYMYNAHYAQTVDITAHVKTSGINVLAVVCGLNLDQVRRSVRPEIRSAHDAIRAFMRMPQMSSGWDFAPHMLLVGPWRPVTLVGHRRVSVEDACVRTDAIDHQAAHLTVAVQARQFGSHMRPPTLHISIHEDSGSPPVWSHSIDVIGDGSIKVPVTLSAPHLWYPQPIGDPFLYTLKIAIACDGEEVDSHTSTFGVRTIELNQDDQFTFIINGEEVFVKGANWVPANSLSWDADPEHYQHLIELAANAHFNMFRIWGGGIYESERFYNLCDRLGIMVWQDFMFSNTRYPDDDPIFMENVTREVKSEVIRLRRHPSIVLWCGNNECLEAWNVGEWPEEAERHFGERLYYSVLPQAISQLAPDIPYWPGSPCGGATTRSLEIGDFHDWYSLPNWRSYEKNAPRFSSEFGCRSVPQRETVDAMISPEFQWEKGGFQHTTWQFHHGWCTTLKELLHEFGSPSTLDEYIQLSQEMQATIMRYAVEVYRRRMYATSGSLIWQYNEPWPAVTFSMVDFFGRPKASYYWVSQAYSPVLGMFHLKDDRLSYWGVNDLRDEKKCTVRIRRFDHSGTLLGEASFQGCLSPNSTTRLIEEFPKLLRIEAADREFLHSELRCDETVSTRVYHTAFRKDWHLPKARMSATYQRIDEETLRVEVASPGYVHFVSLSVKDPHARFTDNFFDLLPNELRVVDIHTRQDTPLTIQGANTEPILLF